MSHIKQAVQHLFIGEMPTAAWGDHRLVGACIGGDQRAWDALIDKHKQMVYSLLVQFGTEADQAAVLFHDVWTRLYPELSNLRGPAAARSWLIDETRRTCEAWRHTQPQGPPTVAPPNQSLWAEAERDQIVREALAQLSPTCQELIGTLLGRTNGTEIPQPASAAASQRLESCFESLAREVERMTAASRLP